MNFRSLVFAALSPLRRGSLKLVTPEGEVRHFGGLGKELRAEIDVHSEEFFRRCVLFGPIGFAESYIDGEWDSTDLTRLIGFFTINAEDSPAMKTPQRTVPPALDILSAYNRFLHRRRPNSLKKSRENIRDHYDLSNDFFRLWLDDSMTYSSAVFEPASLTLAEAQQRKYHLLCKKLRLSPSDHVLEIGTGWGGFSMHAARHFGCRVTTTTISTEQHAEATQRVASAGLADRVRILLEDYRNLKGQFDKIASIEMIEAVGDQYVDGYFQCLSRLSTPYALIGLQAILCPDQQYEILRRGVDFIQKHIFPGSLLMSNQRLLAASSRTPSLNLHDFEDLTPHYARTLRLWRDAFEEQKEAIAALGFDECFHRKWRYYFAYCEAAFASRFISVAQVVFSKTGNLSLNAGSPIEDYRWANPTAR